jgi:uncharacterized protein (DUF885 family)
VPAFELDPDLSELSPVVAGIVAGLRGLSLDDFFDQSYMQLGLRNPEAITEMGIARELGMRNDRLTDLSDAYTRQTQELEAAILALLQTYDRSELSAQQQVSFDVYQWWLDDVVRGHRFTYHSYPVHHFLRSYQRGLVWLFTDAHPLADRQDAEDYVSRLAQVDDQVGQLLDCLRLRERAGVIPPDFIIEWTLPELRGLARNSARASPFYTAFVDRSSGLEGVSPSELQAFREEVAAEVDRSVLPSLRALVDYFEHLQTIATSAAGAWKLPDGEAYYAYMLRHESSSDIKPDEVHELGLAEVARIQAEMRSVFAELGYPEDGNLGELMDRAIQEGGFYGLGTPAREEALIAAYQSILDEAQLRLQDVVDLQPQADLVIVGEEGFTGGGYYTSGARDGSRPGVFHTGTSGSRAPRFNMPTVAYHEAIPGHHFQIGIAQELDLPFFRTELFFNGYAEGWALYAERLAWELGLYDGDPYGNLGRLQLELLRAVRLVVDTGIHAKRWTREEGKAYINEALGDPSGRWADEVERYIVLPAQATGYKIGMLKILELRQRAMDQLGQRFDLREFHHVILGNGGVPLDILDQLVQAYIDAELAGAALVPASEGLMPGCAIWPEKKGCGEVDITAFVVGYAGCRSKG